MDMKQLIAQIDHIESKQILNEGFPTVADTQFRAEPKKQSSKVTEGVNQTSIYEMLIKEFGYDLDERVTIGADGKVTGGFKPQPAAASAVANPYQGADAAKFAAMSPADQAWLTKGGGVPDINDEFILARAPNKGAAVVKPAAPAAGGAAQPAADAPAVSNPQNPGGMSDEEMLARQNPGGMSDEEMLAQQQTAPAGGAAQPSPTTGGDTGEVPGVTTQPGATPAAPAGGGAQPAKPAANKSMTPAITAYASRMGLLKDNKPDVAAIKKFQQDNGLKADGIIGPNTAGAILSAQKPGAGGRGGPTAAQAAQAAPAGGAAQPAPTGKPPRYKTPQEFDQEIARFSKTSDTKLPPNARYIATLQAEKAALGSGGAAQPAATKSALPGATGVPGAQISNTPAAESVRSQDDAILERIRTALFR